jgi:hypothetical protein
MSDPCSNCPCKEIFAQLERNSSRNEAFESKDRQGNPRYISETATPLENKQGKRILAVVLGRNVTKRVMLENIKIDFYGTIGAQYDEHLRLVTEKLSQIGYRRVCLYDVVDDCLTPNNPFIVLRAKSENVNIPLGYGFHLNDDGYRQVLRRLSNSVNNETHPLRADELTMAALLKPNMFSNDNKCIKDLALENTLWILLPLITKSPTIYNKTDTPKLIGLLFIDNQLENPVTHDDLILLISFGDFLGEAINAISGGIEGRPVCEYISSNTGDSRLSWLSASALIFRRG